MPAAQTSLPFDELTPCPASSAASGPDDLPPGFKRLDRHFAYCERCGGLLGTDRRRPHILVETNAHRKAHVIGAVVEYRVKRGQAPSQTGVAGYLERLGFPGAHDPFGCETLRALRLPVRGPQGDGAEGLNYSLTWHDRVSLDDLFGSLPPRAVATRRWVAMMTAALDVMAAAPAPWWLCLAAVEAETGWYERHEFFRTAHWTTGGPVAVDPGTLVEREDGSRWTRDPTALARIAAARSEPPHFAAARNGLPEVRDGLVRVDRVVSEIPSWLSPAAVAVALRCPDLSERIASLRSALRAARPELARQTDGGPCAVTRGGGA